MGNTIAQGQAGGNQHEFHLLHDVEEDQDGNELDEGAIVNPVQDRNDQDIDMMFGFDYSHLHEIKVDSGEGEEGVLSNLPEDCLVHVFYFLSSTDLASVSQVSRTWNRAASDQSLWKTISFTKSYHKVDDILIDTLFGESRRFAEVESISLEGCSAISSKSIDIIRNRCHSLKELLLTGCFSISQMSVIQLVRDTPSLRKLELFMCQLDPFFVRDILDINPHIDLGLFWLTYCAVSGTLEDDSGQARCRFEGQANTGRGCWGEVLGRIVYGTDHYELSGRYPHQILYTCTNHRENDLSDMNYYTCQSCNLLFSQSSMWSEVVCKVCFDHENMLRKDIWISLTPQQIKSINYSFILSKTIRVAQRKNLPLSMVSFGRVPCTLDLTLPAEDSDDEEVRPQFEFEEEKSAMNPRDIDAMNVPLPVFLESNRTRMVGHVHKVKEALNQARMKKQRRAVLVYGDNQEVEVLADRKIILDGKRGAENLFLTLRTWHYGLQILYPFIIVVLSVMLFHTLIDNQAKQEEEDGGEGASYTAQAEKGQNDTSIGNTLIFGAILLGIVVVSICLLQRYGAQCERLFKKFLVADIFVIYAMGAGTLLGVLFKALSLDVDWISFLLVVINFGAGGLAALYLAVPPWLHKFYLIAIDIIMAVFLSYSLNDILLYVLIGLIAILDQMSSPPMNMHLIPPLIVRATPMVDTAPPRLMFRTGDLYVRAIDLIWYGLLAALVSKGPVSKIAGFVLVVSAFCTAVFVLPFFSRHIRPLPVAYVFVAVFSMIQQSSISPFVRSFNFAHSS